MGKILILLILLAGAAFYHPQTRPFMLEFLDPVVTPLLRWQTGREMEEIARELALIVREGQKLPTRGRDFQEWLDRNFHGGSSLDSWGNIYELRTWPDSFGIVSRGPDQEIGTPDDLMTTQILPRRRRR